MQVVNKVAIESVQAPAFLMFCQMATSSFVARMGGALGIVEVDALELEKVQRFMLVVLGFLACVFSNVKVSHWQGLASTRSCPVSELVKE